MSTSLEQHIENIYWYIGAANTSPYYVVTVIRDLWPDVPTTAYYKLKGIEIIDGIVANNGLISVKLRKFRKQFPNVSREEVIDFIRKTYR